MIDLHYWTTPNGHKVTQPCNRRSKKPNDGGKPISVFELGTIRPAQWLVVPR